MSFTYGGDPSASDDAAVRFMIGDTDPAYPLLTDAEIAYTLSSNADNVNVAAIKCLEAIVAKLSKEVDYKIGPEQVSASDRYNQYKAMLVTLQKSQTAIFAAPTAYLPETENAFDVGMHDYLQSTEEVY